MLLVGVVVLLGLGGKGVHLILKLLGEVELGGLRALQVKSAVDLVCSVHHILTNLQRQRGVVIFDLILGLELVPDS